MEIIKGQTFRYRKESFDVNPVAKEQLKNYNRIKKAILSALKDKEMTITMLAEELSMPRNEVVYYVMSLLKYGLVKVGQPSILNSAKN